jgi:hypothetical protein
MDFERLNKVLEDGLKKLGFDGYTVEIGNDFMFYYEENLITYALVAPTRMDTLFRKLYTELGLKYNADIFLLSFFHELGHGETIDDISETLYLYSQNRKVIIGNHTEEEATDELIREYQTLPDEIAATAWACDFINNNAGAVKEFWETFQKELMEFYKENNITND